jgi:hypothetical protein
MAVRPAEDDHFPLRQTLKSGENRISGWSSSRHEGTKRRISATARIENSLSSILCKDMGRDIPSRVNIANPDKDRDHELGAAELFRIVAKRLRQVSWRLWRCRKLLEEGTSSCLGAYQYARTNFQNKGALLRGANGCENLFLSSGGWIAEAYLPWN